MIPISFETLHLVPCRYPHPYQYELDHLEPLPSQLEAVENPSYAPLESTPLTLVDNLEKLQELNTALKNSTEFAVDLEVNGRPGTVLLKAV